MYNRRKERDNRRRYIAGAIKDAAVNLNHLIEEAGALGLTVHIETPECCVKSPANKFSAKITRITQF